MAAIRRDELVRLSGSREYAERILRARRRFERGQATTVQELRKVYRRAAEAVRQDIERLTPGTLQHSHLNALAANLERRARELNQQVLVLAHKGIHLSVETGTEASKEIAAGLLQGAWTRAEVAKLFAPINERAVLAVLSRTGKDGLKLTDRTWRIGERYRNTVQRLVEDAVARGMDSRKLARQVQQYLEPEKWHAMKLETRRRLGVSKDVSYEAMRLARTEMNNAFHEGTIAANAGNPGYRGIYWRLSGSHPIPDICDDMASTMEFGEPGFYPAGKEPSRPHPQCMCVIVPAYEDPGEFTDRLVEWMGDPSSQPDIEEWFQDTGATLLRRPSPIGTLLQGVTRLADHAKRTVIDLQLFSESPKDRIERLIAEGKIDRSVVTRAVEYWTSDLKKGVEAPFGEKMKFAESDLYHLIVDNRLLRHPERLKEMVKGITEVRTADFGRRVALTRWSEGENILVGHLVITPDSHVWSAHVTDPKKVSKMQRKGELLWRK